MSCQFQQNIKRIFYKHYTRTTHDAPPTPLIDESLGTLNTAYWINYMLFFCRAKISKRVPEMLSYKPKNIT